MPRVKLWIVMLMMTGLGVGCSIKEGDIAISRESGQQYSLTAHAVTSEDGRLVSNLTLLDEANVPVTPEQSIVVLSDSLMDSYRVYRVIAGTKYEVHLLENQFLFRTD